MDANKTQNEIELCLTVTSAPPTSKKGLANALIDRGVNLVCPGEPIASSNHWMRGHGTFLDDAATSLPQGLSVGDQDDEGDEGDDGAFGGCPGMIKSALAGTVERINKLVTVRGLRGRYRPEVGDLVIGRIIEVQPKRWKVETGSRLLALLMLGSVNLPGGAQRRKLESDELQMRLFFREGDLLVAEVQAFFGDGSMSLHTRSLKYGKLRNGILVRVPPQLILRLKSHFHSLPCGLDLIIGLNGWIWISQKRPSSQGDDPAYPCEGFEATKEDMYSDLNEPISAASRAKIARVAGCINLLASRSIPITDQAVLQAYEASLEVQTFRPFAGQGPPLGRAALEDGLGGSDKFLLPEFRELVLAAVLSQ